jgi:hypothetical protein
MARKDPHFSLRIPNDLLDAIHRRALENKRSASQEMIHILSQAIKVQDLAGRISQMEERIRLMDDKLSR